MPVLDDIADYLSSQSLGTVGSTIFKSTMPATPDALMALFMTPGPAPIHGMSGSAGSALLERPHVQVLARAGRADDAYLAIQNAHRVLDALGPRTINGVVYHAVYALQHPFFLSEDQTGRRIFACNYEIAKNPATSS